VAKPLTDRLQTNVLQMVLAVAAMLVVVYYGTTALAAQDAVWFLPGFHEQPERLVLYYGGQQVEWLPGRPGFDEMAAAVVQSLDQGTVRGSAIGMSDESIREAYQQYTTLEVFFERPVKLHAGVNTGNPTQMLFPITGRHSELNVVFLGKNGKYMSNGPLLKTVQPIRDTLRSLGYPSS
jgi:hypothetical protein